MKSLKERNRLLKNRRRKMRGFHIGMRVMGQPGQFGKVVGHVPETASVTVWWDSGTESVVSPHSLTPVKQSRI